MFKKFLALALVLMLVLSCVGCDAIFNINIFSGDSNTENNITNTPTEEDEPSEPNADEPTDEKPTEQGTHEQNTESVTEGPVFTTDPYKDVNESEFYANYKPAVSASDAYYRTQHNLMSGDISEQNQAPTLSQYRPMQNGKYIRNTTLVYSDDGDAYYVYDAYGHVANIIYRDGAYVTLEDVAAYVYAFGTVPPNYSEGKSGNPALNPWGIYLRLNHSRFSGNTNKYPYEPVLPDISGCGGDLQYYEIDIGTTGTTSGNYAVRPYNNGTSITRGAARIVYTRQDKNGNGVFEIDEIYVFYTYNHYNDFQEYLNYEGGWGEMFGNITGGGELSSKENYNPTPYVKTEYADFRTQTLTIEIVCILPTDMTKRQLV